MLQDSRRLKSSDRRRGAQVFDLPPLRTLQPDRCLNPMQIESRRHPVAFDEGNRYRTFPNPQSPHLRLEGQHLLPIQGQLDFLGCESLPAQIAQTPQRHLFSHDAPGRTETDALELHRHAAFPERLEKAILEALRNTHLIQVQPKAHHEGDEQVNKSTCETEQPTRPGSTGPDGPRRREALGICTLWGFHGLVSLGVTGGALNQGPMYS